jgi:hypothetical protein
MDIQNVIKVIGFNIFGVLGYHVKPVYFSGLLDDGNMGHPHVFAVEALKVKKHVITK